MNFVYLVLGLIFFTAIARYIFINIQRRKSNFLIISSFMQLIPLGFSKIFYLFSKDMIGAFGNSIEFQFSLLYVVVLFILKKNKFIIKLNRWFYIISILFLISFFNSINPLSIASVVLIWNIVPLILMLGLLDKNLSKEEIIKGIYDGLLITTFIQLILTIFYPILGMEWVTTLFRDETTKDWILRREGYPSTVGTFIHPGPLALYCIITSCFFLSSFLNNYNKKTSLLMVLVNVFIIYFTYSRTSYIVTIITYSIILFSFYRSKNIINLKIIFLTIFALLIFYYLVYLSPLSKLFLESDSNEQKVSRFLHYGIALDIFSKSPFWGIGINSHVLYMDKYISLGNEALNFFTKNPIHNIHLIILVETGIIGFLIWLYYFFSRIIFFFLNSRIGCRSVNIFNLTFLGVLIANFSYGFTGWASFNKELFTLSIVLGYFANSSKLKSSV